MGPLATEPCASMRRDRVIASNYRVEEADGKTGKSALWGHRAGLSEIFVAIDAMAGDGFRFALVPLQKLISKFSQNDTYDARLMLSRHHKWMKILSAVLGASGNASITVVPEALRFMRMFAEGDPSIIYLDVELTLALVNLSRHENATMRQEAKTTLKIILDQEFYEWTFTGAYSTLDIIHDMLNDPVDCPLAAVILSKLTRCMDARMSRIVSRKFGATMKEAAFIMASALSKNASPAPVLIQSAEAICGFLCNCLVHPESYPIAMSFDFIGAVEALKGSIASENQVLNRATKSIQLAKMHYPGKKAGLRCDFQQLLSFLNTPHLAAHALSLIISTGTNLDHGDSDVDSCGLAVAAVKTALQGVIQRADHGYIFERCIRLIDYLLVDYLLSTHRSSFQNVKILLDTLMRRIVNIIQDDFSPDMLEHTLGGLSALLRHERIQNELQLAGGTAAFLHHLQTLKCQDPSESLLRVTWGSIVNYLPIYGILGTDLYTNPVEPENKLSLYFCLTREALIPLSYKMRIIQAIDPQDLAKSDPGSFIAGVVDGLHEMLTSRDMGQKAEAAKYVSGLWKKPHLSTKFAGTLEVMLDHLLSAPNINTLTDADVTSAQTIFDSMLVILKTDIHQDWLARRTLPANKMKLLAGRLTSFIKECCNPRELERPMDMTATMYQHNFVPMYFLEMPGLIMAITVTFSQLSFIPATAWACATQILLGESLSAQGRKRLKAAGVYLVLVFERAIEHPYRNVRIRACEALSKFTIDFWDIPYITRNGFVTPMLECLTMAKDDPTPSMPAIALSIAKIMRQSKDGYNLVKDRPSWNIVLLQLLADEWGMGCAFGLLTGCPLEHQRTVWSKDGRLSKLVSYTKHSQLPRLNEFIFVRLKTLAEGEEDLQSILMRTNVVGCISASLSQHLLSDKTRTNSDWIACSVGALSLLSSLPLSGEIVNDLLRSGGIFHHIAKAFDHQFQPLVSSAIRNTYRMAMQGTTAIRRAINGAMLGGLIKLHAHSVYSSHAEASETIKELASDPEVLPALISRIGVILKTSVCKPIDSDLASTALLVVDELASNRYDDEALTCCLEMVKVGVLEQVQVMASESESLPSAIKSRAKQSAAAIYRVLPSQI